VNHILGANQNVTTTTPTIRVGMLVKDRTLTIYGRVSHIDSDGTAHLTLTRSHRSASVFHGTRDGKGVHVANDARIIGDTLTIQVHELLPIRWAPSIRRAQPYTHRTLVKYGSRGRDIVIPSGCAPWIVDYGSWSDVYLTRKEARASRQRYMSTPGTVAE